MRLNDVEMTILIRDRPITEYQHDGQTLVEGRAGSEYEIAVRNHTWQRLETILSVDGLSVIDGKPAGTQSQGYLIEGGATIRIPGWMLDAKTVAKFAFASMKQSYTAQSGGDDRNNGVIGALVYREKMKPIVYNHNSLIPRSIYGSGVSDTGVGTFSGIASNGCLSNATSYNAASIQCSTQSAAPRGICPQYSDVVDQGLGTAFGQATDFATQTVAFERGDLLTTLLCYYDDKRGLKARGIVIERPVKPIPQAFPAGCTPPRGWLR
jgi:hypothetical protein